MATAGYVNPMSEFYYNDERVTGGIPWHFANELIEAGGGLLELPRGNLSFNPEVYKLTAQRMVLRAGAAIATDTDLIDCEMDERRPDRIRRVIIHDRSGLAALEARCFIDATGDAVLSHLAGVEMLPDTRPAQPASMCFIMSNVDTTTERMKIVHLRYNRMNHQATFVREKLLALREEGEKVPLFGGPWLSTTLQDGCITVNMSRGAVDATDAGDYARASQSLLEDVFVLADLLVRHIPEFRNATLTSVSPCVGIRQSRRIRGLCVMTGQDYVDGTRFEDSIARACHPVDIHLPGNEGQKLTFPPEAGYIPLRSLIPEHRANLLVAGRCVSADEDAFAAIRVQAPCMEMGQATGYAAAIAVRSCCAVQEINRAEVVDAVRRAGSFV